MDSQSVWAPRRLSPRPAPRRVAIQKRGNISRIVGRAIRGGELSYQVSN